MGPGVLPPGFAQVKVDLATLIHEYIYPWLPTDLGSWVPGMRYVSVYGLEWSLYSIPKQLIYL